MTRQHEGVYFLTKRIASSCKRANAPMGWISSGILRRLEGPANCQEASLLKDLQSINCSKLDGLVPAPEAGPGNTLVVTAAARGALLDICFPTGQKWVWGVSLAWVTMVPCKIPVKNRVKSDNSGTEEQTPP